LQDECLQKKLHFANQVVYGSEYMSNESNAELDTLIESIPKDCAMFCA